ncbi:MAG: glycosyltransferase family 4 protein [Candidatus Hodarchaeales archaeon]|jgi:glycosyltransferase involved in cell wall biosynthesis
MLNYEYPPLGGGAGIVTKNLATALGDLDIKIDIITMHMKGLIREETTGNVRIFRVPSIRRRKDICDFPEMASFIPSALFKSSILNKKEKYDLNHTHFIIPTGIISLVLKKISKLPYIITVHGSDVPGYNPDRFNLLHLFIKNPWKQVILNSSMVSPLSERIKRMIDHRIDFPQMKIVPNALPIDRLKPELKKRSILVVTRLLPRKGIQYLLEALNSSGLDIHVDIVGDGPYRNNLEVLSKNLKLDIKFHGWIDNSSLKLTKLYQRCEFFIFPSESENFPIVLLEAMASGSTIITTRDSGCEYVVGDSALLVPPKDSKSIEVALNKLVLDRSFSQKLGKKARLRFEKNFTWGKVAKQYLDIYHAIINNKYQQKL